MKNGIFTTLLLFCSLTLTSQAYAVMLSLQPSSSTANIGDTIDVNFVVSGLTAGAAAPSVGHFDIDITWSGPQLMFDSVAFGPYLGDPADPTETQVSILPPGVFVGLSEQSLLTPAALDALQPANFTLATVTFTAAALGNTVVSGDLFALDDAFGNRLLDPFGPVDSAHIDVLSVAEPVSLALLGVGILGLGVIHQRKRTSKY